MEKITIELVQNGWTITSGDTVYIAKSPEKVLYYVGKLLGLPDTEKVSAETK